MQPSPSARMGSEPASAEEAVMSALVTVGRHMRQRLPGEEIEFSLIPLLKLVRDNGPTRLSVLATCLGLDASTVSRQVSHLEQRGMLARTDDPEDRRASRVTLSDVGRRRLEEGAARRRALIAAALDGWTDEDREQLRVLLFRLQNDLTSPSDPQETP